MLKLSFGLATGKRAPVLALQTVEEETIQVSELWPAANATLLIFLRHLA